MHVKEVQKGSKRDKGPEKVSGEVKGKNIPNLLKNKNLTQIQHALSTPIRTDTNILALKYITVKLLSYCPNEGQNWKAAKEK